MGRIREIRAKVLLSHCKDPDGWFGVNLKADQRAPGRQAENESAGAINWVDDPAVGRITVLCTMFLTKNAVIRVSFPYKAANNSFGGPIAAEQQLISSPGVVLMMLSPTWSAHSPADSG